MMKFTANDVRKRILSIAYKCNNNTHLGGSLSIVELLTVLYRDVLNYKFDDPKWSERDIFILSKGHCALALDAVLNVCGVISDEESDTFLQNGSDFGSHPVMNIEHGIECSSGSLGQGVSMAVGIAKASKIKGKSNSIYVLVGNGECNEGAVWEAAMLASQWKLSNLTFIIDSNGFQSDGESSVIVNMSSIAGKFESFGFCVTEIDGHDENQIYEAYVLHSGDRPKAIVANTIKGKGISFMEGNNTWHHNRLIDEMYCNAMEELESCDGD